MGCFDMAIERGVYPIPTRGKYNFDDWGIGDSDVYETLEKVESAQNAAHAWAKRRDNGARFSRKMTDNGYRLWRVA